MDWEEYGRGWTSNITEWTGKNMVEAGRATSQSGLGRIWQRLDEKHQRVDWEEYGRGCIVDWEEYGRGWTSNITEWTGKNMVEAGRATSQIRPGRIW